jgi:hypothetical protein
MGSAPLTQALIDKIQAIFPRAVLANSYGTTEAGPTPFGPHPARHPAAPPLALGYPIPGAEAELREGPSSKEGVLYMRSPMLMEGYNNLPDRTAEAVQDGWYRSGDIMRRDEDGFFYFVGRADDMFVVGGENVWPGEVERPVGADAGRPSSRRRSRSGRDQGRAALRLHRSTSGASLDEAAVKPSPSPMGRPSPTRASLPSGPTSVCRAP